MKTLPNTIQAVIEIIRSQGHAVEWRINKNGSPRFSIDGAKECDARTMSKRFSRYGV